MRRILWGVWLLVGALAFSWQLQTTTAQETVAPATSGDEPIVHLFGRDDCGFCKQMFAWLEEEDIPYVYHNIIEDERAREQFNAIAEKHSTSKVTPLSSLVNA